MSVLNALLVHIDDGELSRAIEDETTCLVDDAHEKGWYEGYDDGYDKGYQEGYDDARASTV